MSNHQTLVHARQAGMGPLLQHLHPPMPALTVDQLDYIARCNRGARPPRGLTWSLLFVCFPSFLPNCVTPHVSAQLPSLELHALSQPIAQIGSTIELTLVGSRIDELQSLHFSSLHVTAEPLSKATTALGENSGANSKFKTYIAEGIKPGHCEVRAQGRFGLSNPRRLWLTRKPVIVSNAEHSHAAAAVELTPGKIFVARCQPRQRNFYHLQVEAGQSLKLAVYAQQLESRATPIVVLYGPDRRELARSRAVGQWPAEISYQSPLAGDFEIVVHDAIFQGGHEYAYAIETSVSQIDEPAAVLELDQLLRPQCPASAVDSVAKVTVAKQTVAKERATVGAEIEKPLNNEALPEQLPLSVAGVFAVDRTPCVFDFAATKDQQLVIEVHSHSVGQLTDPRFVLYRLLPTIAQEHTAVNGAAAEAVTGQAGKPEVREETSEGTTKAAETQQQLLEQDDPPAVGNAGVRIVSRDPRAMWTVPESGRYRIELQDNESGSRQPDQMRYTLDVRVARPDFQLLAYPLFPNNQPALSRPSGINLVRGGTAAVRVLAVRCDGYNEPIEANVSGLPHAATALPITFHPTQNEATIMLTCSDQAEAWSGPIQIIGRAFGTNSPSVLAEAATISWPAIPTYNALQWRRSDDLMLCIQPLDTAPLSIALGGEAILQAKQGEKLSIPLQITRRAGGDSACVLRPQALPAKVTSPELNIAADQSAGNCELTIAADAPLGEFSIWMQAETKVKWRDNPQALQRAEERLASLNTALTDTLDTDQKQSLAEAIKQTSTHIEALKTATAEKELTLFLPTTSQRIRVLAK